MLRASPVYQERPERRGVSRRRVIDEAKAKVSVIELVDLLCGPAKMRRVGDEWIARCPLKDHEDKTPSFAVNPAKNVWFSHGCLRGGDVVELARFAWDFDNAAVAVAAACLLMKFGHEVPPRPASWFARQERQKPIRDGIDSVRREIKRRRLFRCFILPVIDTIEAEGEREQELERAWSDFQRVPLP
jgi:DNA primase